MGYQRIQVLKPDGTDHKTIQMINDSVGTIRISEIGHMVMGSGGGFILRPESMEETEGLPKLMKVLDLEGKVQDEYGDHRLTEIVEETRELTIEDMIVEEDMVVTISNSGYIKRNPITLYQSQRRGGKGKTAMGTKEEDFVEHLFVASTHHSFLFFTREVSSEYCRCYAGD